MKTRMLHIACIMFVMAILHSAYGQTKDGLGVGLMVGEPTGISLKKWIDADRAFDAGIAWSFSDNASLHFHGDYLIHRNDDFPPPELKGKSRYYYGLGFRIKLKEDNRGRGKNDDDAMIGIRIPLGITYLFSEAPIDIFAEIVPILDVAPDTDVRLNAAIGVRYYFGK
ncbi:MAG TPA: DUF3996 domain-containing protein [Kiritimatiellia bacterium]|nr:DUF3996 domain-containing protein [Kiritimatiellia bacterium]